MSQYDELPLEEEEVVLQPSIPLHDPAPESRSKKKKRVKVDQDIAIEPEVANDELPTTKFKLKGGILRVSDMDIFDEFGGALYEVKVIGAFHPRMNLLDASTGEIVGSLKHKWGILRTWIITCGDITAQIKHKLSLKGFRCDVTFPDGSPPLLVSGSMRAMKYKIKRDEEVLLTCKRKFCRHFYEVHGGDVLFMHCLVCAINKILLTTRRRP